MFLSGHYYTLIKIIIINIIIINSHGYIWGNREKENKKPQLIVFSETLSDLTTVVFVKVYFPDQSTFISLTFTLCKDVYPEC